MRTALRREHNLRKRDGQKVLEGLHICKSDVHGTEARAQFTKDDERNTLEKVVCLKTLKQKLHQAAMRASSGGERYPLMRRDGALMRRPVAPNVAMCTFRL